MDPNQRLCPACGARNKPTWEFCVRCGESLVPEEAAAPTEIVSPEAEAPRPAGGVPWRGVLAFMAVLGALVAGWRMLQRPIPPPQGDLIVLVPVAEPVRLDPPGRISGPGGAAYS